MPPAWTVVLIFLLIPFSLVFFWKRLPAIFQDSGIPQIFKNPDVTLCLLLSGFFLWMAYSGGSGERVVTVQGIVFGGVFYISLLLILTGFLVFRNVPLSQAYALSLSNFSKNFRLGLIWLVAGYPLVMGAQALSYFLGDSAQAQELVQFLANSASIWDVLLIALFAVVVAPLVEEILFRGYFYGVASQYLGVPISLLSTSLVFALIHGHLPSLAGLFVLGFLLGVVREKTGSVWVPVLLHAIFNGISVAGTLLWPDLVS